MSLMLALSAGCSSDPAPPPADAAVTVDGGAPSDAPDGGALPVDVNLGPARAVFDLDADTAQPTHFYDLPFPSDLRRTAAAARVCSATRALPQAMAAPDPANSRGASRCGERPMSQ